jgi:hypothetical protein
MATLFAPETQFLLRHAVGITEQYGLAPGFMLDPFPARGDEYVARPPVECLSVDGCSAMTLGGDKPGRIGAGLWQRGETIRQLF